MEIRRTTQLEDVDAIMQIRKKVFIQEQQVPEDLEIDNWDNNPQTSFFLAKLGQLAVGCARIRPYSEETTAKVERVAILPEYRGKKIGEAIMLFIEKEAQDLGFTRLFLNSQIHAKGFYQKLGYQTVGEIFEEAGIPHIAMEKGLI